MDVTPPKFTGVIKVAAEGGSLVARWKKDAFFDQEDQEPLSFEAAIGNCAAT